MIGGKRGWRRWFERIERRIERGKGGRKERNFWGRWGWRGVVSVDVNPAAHFPFDVAVPPPSTRGGGGGGSVAAELVSVNCNAFWPIRDYTMK